MFHSLTAHGIEQMLKFCVESPGFETGQIKHRIFCVLLPSGPSFVCGEWWTLELTMCSTQLCQSHTYHHLRQTLPQRKSRLKYWLLRPWHSKCSPRIFYTCYTVTQHSSDRYYTGRKFYQQTIAQDQWQCCFKGPFGIGKYSCGVNRHCL
jgi:hypothetical protein